MLAFQTAARASIARQTAYVLSTKKSLLGVFARFASTGGSRDDVEARIINLLKGFDKVEASKVNGTAHFANDLGLDSLDTVEVVMAIEEEFAIEIPDKDADEILTVKQATDYITNRSDAF